jgi:glycosyltransferase involved in cell wall biosynthesis
MTEPGKTEPGKTPTAAETVASAVFAGRISAVVPARNEEAVIATCVESLAQQPEIAEVFVVDDQSTDRTAEIVRGLAARIPKIRLLRTEGPPGGWVGKNYAVWIGAQQASEPWLLFTDADAEHLPRAAAHALELAREHDAAIVSFSPEQIVRRWYEKALIPLVFTRLAKLYSYDAVNDPKSPVAAANGQFLLIRREVYESVGGHASLPGEVLEDLALARMVKRAGYRLWFGSGAGFVRVRMYRSFSEMWQGWKKNLYRLIGGTPRAMYSELDDVVPWMVALVLLLGIKIPFALFIGVVLLLARQVQYGLQLTRNHYPISLIVFYIPAIALYTAVLRASYRSHQRGTVQWKGREYRVEWPQEGGKEPLRREKA